MRRRCSRRDSQLAWSVLGIGAATALGEAAAGALRRREEAAGPAASARSTNTQDNSTRTAARGNDRRTALAAPFVPLLCARCGDRVNGAGGEGAALIARLWHSAAAPHAVVAAVAASAAAAGRLRRAGSLPLPPLLLLPRVAASARDSSSLTPTTTDAHRFALAAATAVHAAAALLRGERLDDEGRGRQRDQRRGERSSACSTVGQHAVRRVCGAGGAAVAMASSQRAPRPKPTRF